MTENVWGTIKHVDLQSDLCANIFYPFHQAVPFRLYRCNPPLGQKWVAQGTGGTKSMAQIQIFIADNPKVSLTDIALYIILNI